MERVQYVDITVELVFDGYRPSAPPDDPWSSVDAKACQSGRCSNCHHRGLNYRPWWKPGSYRAFASCPKCGWVDEF